VLHLRDWDWLGGVIIQEMSSAVGNLRKFIGIQTSEMTRLHSVVHHVVRGAHGPPRQHLADFLRD
jgi:hypothetical protein